MNTLKRFFAFAMAFLMALAFWGCESIEDFSSSTPEDAVKNYYKAFEEKNTKAFIANTSKAKFVNMGSTEAYAEEIIESSLSEAERAYGKNVKFEILKITEVDYFSTIELARIQKEYTETEALSNLEVKDAADVTFDIKIKGDSAEKTGVGEACVILENGTWKIYALELHI